LGNTYEATKKSERNKISFGAQLGMNSQSAARLTALNAISPRDGATVPSLSLSFCIPPHFSTARGAQLPPTMMLLMGMKTSFTV